MKESRDFLEPLTGAVKRKKFCTVDIESKDGDTRTTPGFTRPFLIGTYDPLRKIYQEFRDEPRLMKRPWQERALAPDGCIGKVLAYLLSRSFSGYTIYAHNGGGFDHLFWLRWLRMHEEEYGFEIVPVQSSIQLIKVWRLPDNEGDPIEHTWTFLDSMKLFPSGLEKLCKTFGLPGKVDHDLGLDEDDPTWSTYLKQDCIALADGLTKIHDLVEEKLGGEVGMTAPSTSMKLFRRRFLGRKGSVKRIPRHAHWNECTALRGTSEEAQHAECPGCAHEWVRRGYYGGRTELFRTYGEKLRYVDLNSSYVAAMREDMPVGDRLVTTELDWRMAENYAGFVECSVYIPPECEIPPLPHRALTGKLMFPTGTFHGVWSTKELQLLDDPLVRGRITKVKKVVWFRLQSVFTGMVDELWRLRDKSEPDYDEGLSALAKLMGNSLYGKFGMKQQRTSIVFARYKDMGHCFLCQEELHGKDGLCDECVGSKPASEDSGDVWYQAKKVEAAYIIPHIAAHITALARIRLWGYMKMAVEKGGKIYYCDSVTGDRTTVVRSKKGIEVLTFEELWKRTSAKTKSRGKEFGELPGYEALAQDAVGKDGWFPLERVIRHETTKTTHRISTKHGQTEVTTDHGIMVNGREVTPEAFVREEARFTSVSAPAVVVRKKIDLFEYVKDWSHERLLKNPPRIETLRFTCDDEYVFLPTNAWQEQRSEESTLRFKRWFDSGSEDTTALLRLVGAYVSDGSASLTGMTTTSRYMLSFCKADLNLQTQLRDDLVALTKDVTILGPLWSDTVYVVRSGTIMMACLFAALSGVKSRGKFLPAFCYELGPKDAETLRASLTDGDGHVDAGGQLCYTTNSPKLAAGISFFLSQQDQEHGWSFRPDKEAWTLRTRPKGSERNRYSLRHEPRAALAEGQERFVYDLSVAGAHTFVDGIGRVLLHNTDSILSDVDLPTSNDLGALKDEYPGQELTGTFVQPKVYMLESESFSAPKVTMKGFPYRRTDIGHGKDAEGKPCGCSECIIRCKENLLKLQAGETLEWRQLEKVRTLASKGFKRGPLMRTVKKSFKSKYDKRIINEDGLSTRAVVLDEPDPDLRKHEHAFHEEAAE